MPVRGAAQADGLRLNAAGVVFSGLYALALGWLVLGLGWRVGTWVRTPQPSPIPIAPAPRTRLGVAGRLAAEIVLFRSLFRANRTTWAASVLMHWGLLLVLVVHARFLYRTLPLWLVPFLVASGWATLAALAGIAVLAARRALVDRMRYITVPSDWAHLALLGAILLSGTLLKRVWPTDLAAVGAWLRGTLALDWRSLPDHLGLWAHLALVAALLAVYPISKLVHAPGVAFAPTFHQRDRAGRGR